MMKYNSDTRGKILYLENKARFACCMCLANVLGNTMLESDSWGKMRHWLCSN